MHPYRNVTPNPPTKIGTALYLSPSQKFQCLGFSVLGHSYSVRNHSPRAPFKRSSSSVTGQGRLSAFVSSPHGSALSSAFNLASIDRIASQTSRRARTVCSFPTSSLCSNSAIKCSTRLICAPGMNRSQLNSTLEISAMRGPSSSDALEKKETPQTINDALRKSPSACFSSRCWRRPGRRCRKPSPPSRPIQASKASPVRQVRPSHSSGAQVSLPAP